MLEGDLLRGEKKINDKVEEEWEFSAEGNVCAKALWLKESVQYRMLRGDSVARAERVGKGEVR